MWDSKLELHDLVRLPAASQPAIALGGRHAAFTLRTSDAKHDHRRVHIADLRHGGIRSIQTADADSHSPAFSPDGRSLALVIDSPDGGARLALTSLDAPDDLAIVAEHEGSIDELVFSPAGERVAYIAEYDPEHRSSVPCATRVEEPPRATSRIDYKRNNLGWVGDRRSHVYIVDLVGGMPQRLTHALHEHLLPAWSPNGETIAASRYDWGADTSQLLLLSPRDGQVQALVGHTAGQVRAWGWAPDGAAIVFMGTESWDPQPDFYVFDCVAGTTRRITHDLGCLPEPRTPLYWRPDGSVLFTAAQHGRSGLFSLRVEDGTVERVGPEVELTNGLALDTSFQHAAQIHSGPHNPPELLVARLDDAVVWERVGDSESGRPCRVKLPSVQPFRTESSGDTVDGWLWLPADLPADDGYPVVVHVHGGPESFTGPVFDPELHALTTAGYAVITGNPRGSTSYGRAWAAMVFQNWGPGPFADYTALLEAACDLAPLDRDRVGIMGTSYGGYMTAYAVGHTHRFRAAVAIAVTFDLVSQFWSADNDHVFGEMGWGGSPHTNPGFYAEQSPHMAVDNVRTPTLLLHGERDELTPLGQAEEMFRALKKNGCETELVIYPGGFHAFRRDNPPPHREDALHRIVDWFDRFLRACNA